MKPTGAEGKGNMEMTTIEMDWTEDGCDATVQIAPGIGLEIACPACGTVIIGHHQCGDRLPKKRKLRTERHTGDKEASK